MNLFYFRSFHVGPAPYYRLEFDGFTGDAGSKLIKVSELLPKKYAQVLLNTLKVVYQR